MRNRLILFGAWCAFIFGLYSVPLIRLIRHSFNEGYSSHIALVPLISAALIWSGQREIFRSISNSSRIALLFTAVSISVSAGCFLLGAGIDSEVTAFIIVITFLMLIAAGFIAAFGIDAFKRAAFPFTLFVFVLPFPDLILNGVINFLQSASADLTYWTFKALAVPVLRNGFILSVPGVSIQVAAECSGINSSIALLILMVIFANQTLHSTWRRIVLILVAIPLSIIKNAIRIVSLTLLATNVDPSFLTGNLHHRGGVVFFLISLALLFPIWKLLRRNDKIGESVSPKSMALSVSRPNL